MASRFLVTLALAHETHEGHFPGSLSSRNNNSGNLRFNDSLAKFYGAKLGKNGFAIFTHYQTGFRALCDDITAKICGKSKHIDYSKNPTFLDYVKVYAPAEDNNNPMNYCAYLCSKMTEWKLTASTPLSVMCMILKGDLTEVPHDEPVMNITPEAHLRGLENRLSRTVSEGARNLLLSVIQRLKKRLSIS